MCSKAAVIKTAWYKHRNRDRWNRTETSEINPHIYHQLIFATKAQISLCKEGSILKEQHWENWISTHRDTKDDNYHTPHTKINSKWIEDHYLWPDTIKILPWNFGGTLQDISIVKDFLEKTPKAQTTKAKVNRWDSMRLRSFCTAKGTVNRGRRQLTEENIFKLCIW